MSHVIHHTRLLSLLLLLLMLGGEAKVRAQTLTSGGYDLRLFRPAVDSKGLASVNGTEVVPHLAYSFGLTLDGAFNLLPYQGYLDDSTRTPTEAQRQDFLVQQYFTGLLHFNVGLYNRLSVGAQLPIVVIRGGNVQAPGRWNETVEGGLGYQGVGNLSLHAKYRILHPDKVPIGLAAILQVGLPTSLGVSATNAVVSTRGDDVTYQSHATYGAGLALRVSPAVDLIAEGYGNQILGASHGTTVSKMEMVVQTAARSSSKTIRSRSSKRSTSRLTVQRSSGAARRLSTRRRRP